MTRNPANSSSADDSWEQLEADLFGVEAGKEYTAAERVASEPAPDVPSQPDVIIPKPIEEDDFGDFGAGLVETAGAEPRRAPSKPKPPARAKPVAKAPEPPPAKVAPPEPAAAFDFDLDEGPTDEELDAAAADDDIDEEIEAAVPPEEDPYWDALANWNWQEDDRSGKPRSDAGRERSRQPSRGDSSGPRRGDRNRSPSSRDSSERRSPPSQSREVRPAAEDRPHSAHRRSPADRDRSRVEEPRPIEPVCETPQITDPESIPSRDEAAPEVKSRRQDRRRSRRHTSSTAQPVTEAAFESEGVEESNDIGWPSEPETRETPRSAPVDEPRSRAAADDLDDDFEEDVAEAGERVAEATDDEGQPRRRRSRRRRRRPDRPAAGRVESPADEDIKELEEDPFVSDLEDESGERSSAEAGDDESAEEGRSGRGRRPRRRRRGGRGGERPAPAPAPTARVESGFDDEEEEEDEVLEADDPYFEDRDREFVEDDEPPRPRRRGRSSSRPATVRATHLDEEDDDEDDGEPEPGVSYEDVPSWEEAISYLLNPSLVEGASGSGGDRASSSSDRGSGNDRGNRGGGDRGSRPPRRGPRRDA